MKKYMIGIICGMGIGASLMTLAMKKRGVL